MAMIPLLNSAMTSFYQNLGAVQDAVETGTSIYNEAAHIYELVEAARRRRAGTNETPYEGAGQVTSTQHAYKNPDNIPIDPAVQTEQQQTDVVTQIKESLAVTAPIISPPIVMPTVCGNDGPTVCDKDKMKGWLEELATIQKEIDQKTCQMGALNQKKKLIEQAVSNCAIKLEESLPLEKNSCPFVKEETKEPSCGCKPVARKRVASTTQNRRRIEQKKGLEPEFRYARMPRDINPDTFYYPPDPYRGTIVPYRTW